MHVSTDLFPSIFLALLGEWKLKNFMLRVKKIKKKKKKKENGKRKKKEVHISFYNIISNTTDFASNACLDWFVSIIVLALRERQS